MFCFAHGAVLHCLTGRLCVRRLQWKKTASALADAEREGFIVQKKLEEAAEKAALSNKAKYEADEARRLAEEAKSQAKCATQPTA